MEMFSLIKLDSNAALNAIEHRSSDPDFSSDFALDHFQYVYMASSDMNCSCDVDPDTNVYANTSFGYRKCYREAGAMRRHCFYIKCECM